MIIWTCSPFLFYMGEDLASLYPSDILLLSVGKFKGE